MRVRSPSPAQRNDRIGIALAATATVIVGTAVAVSGELTDYPVLGGQAVRYGLGAALLLGWVGLRRIHLVRPTPREVVHLALLAASGLAGFNVCVVLALRDAEPAAVGVVVGAVPLVLALAGPIAERRRPAGPVLAGALLVVAGGALVQGLGRTTLVAFLLSLGALVGEAAFTLLAVPVLPRLGAVAVSLWSCVLAALMLAVIGIAGTRFRNLEEEVVDVAPEPVLAGLVRLHERVGSLAEVRGGVLVRRAVAAAHVPAFDAAA